MSASHLEFADDAGIRYTSSAATRTRRKTKRVKKGGKPGNPGSFSPGRLALFAEHQPEFNSLKKTARTKQNQFWDKFFKIYWLKFPWVLPLKNDPEEDGGELPDEALFSPEEREAKGKTVEDVTQAVKRHMRYVRDRLQQEDNPWASVLGELGTVHTAPPAAPRQLAPWQLYMSKKAAKIEEVLEERRATEDVSSKEVLALRSAIARDLLAQETKEYRDALQDECRTMRVAEDAAEEARVQDESAQTARERMTAVVQPLLELLRQHTGMYITLLAGLPLPGGSQMKVISAGKTAGPVPVPWHLCDAERFKREVMGSFTMFLSRTQDHNVSKCTTLIHDTEGIMRSANGQMTTMTPGGSQSPSLSSASSAGLASRASQYESASASTSKRKAARDLDESSSSSDDDANGEEDDQLADERSGDGWGPADDEDEDGDEDENDEGTGLLGEGDGMDTGDDEDLGDDVDMDNLTLNDAVKRQLALRSPRTRRTELRELGKYGEFDLQTLCSRVAVAEIMMQATSGPTIIPLTMSPMAVIASQARKAKQRASKKSRGRLSLPTRASDRIASLSKTHTPSPLGGTPVSIS
ncbi:hypothetical protein C2E23DRAFT_745135 [Lenzites betulinus]|nr:hypothetical protein C2E23DRAFT_745135 [Lenzites betulinus]